MNLRRFIPNTRTDPERPSIDLEAEEVTLEEPRGLTPRRFTNRRMCQ